MPMHKVQVAAAAYTAQILFRAIEKQTLAYCAQSADIIGKKL